MLDHSHLKQEISCRLNQKLIRNIIQSEINRYSELLKYKFN